jgi:hypothetical protein
MAIKDVNIAPDAAIAVSKINITAASIPWTSVDTIGKIKDADVASDAAIVGSKMVPDFGAQEVKTETGFSVGTTFKTTIKGDPSEDYDLILPDADGSSGQALVKSALGHLEWASVPGLALTQYNILVGDSSNLPVPINTNTVGDIKADETAGLTIKALAITNAMISASAGIVFSKMAALTASRALVSDGSGVVSVATTTAAEIGYVNGVTSAIQTQLTARVVGPASAVNNNFAAFDTTTGKLVKDSGSKAADFATAASVAPLTAAVTATTEPTGFEDCANVVVTYSSAAQTITLTHSSGTIYYWVSGVRLSLTSPWTSTAHTDTVGHKYWLSISGAGASVWETDTFPGFDKCLVANCVYYTAYKFGIREVHGLMPNTAHKEFHNVVGSYRGSGGSAVAASYAALTNTIAAVTPDVDEAVINDEDLPTTIAAFAAAEGYTQLYFDTNAATFVTGAALPYLVTGTPGAGNPLYNENPITGTALTEITNINRWFNVYTIFVPVTADAASQAYRMLWLTGQKIYTTLSAAQSEDFRTVALGNLQTLFSEFLPYIRWSFIRTNSNLTYATQVAATPTYLLGTAAQLVSVSGFNPVDHNALTGRSDSDSHPASAITGTAVTLAGAEVLTNKDYNGGAASTTPGAVRRITVPSGTTAELAALTRSEASLTYDKTTKKLNVDDGSALKVVGGGLVVTVLDAPATSGVNLEAGKHYIVTGLTADTTLNLPAGGAEAALRVSVLNNGTSGYRVTLARAGSDTIAWDGTTTYTDAKIMYADQWVELSWRTTYWVIDDASSPLNGTFSGALTVTGLLTASTGIALGSGTDIMSVWKVGTDWAPTIANGGISSQTGTLTSVTVSEAQYIIFNKMCFVHIKVLVTNKGSGAGQLIIATPSGCNPSANSVLNGAEVTSVGYSLFVTASLGNSSISVMKYDNTTNIADNKSSMVSGWFPIA